MKKIILIIALLFLIVSYSQEKQSDFKTRLESRAKQNRIDFEKTKVCKDFKLKIKKELVKSDSLIKL